MADVQSLYSCPRCQRGPLTRTGEQIACAACSGKYPVIGGLPWLYPDPDYALGEWRNRYTAYLEDFANASRSVAADLAAATRESTRRRLQYLRDGYDQQSLWMRDLLRPLELVDSPLAAAAQQAFATRLPLTQDLHSYYANVHRDWCWGDAENRMSLQLAQRGLLPASEAVLVLGAGAGRLTYDLHQARERGRTIGLDINPMLLLVAQRLASGGGLSLVEFPLAPRTAADVAVCRRLSAPGPARPGLEFVCANAWAAPFPAQTFDVVVTPWLIDIVGEDLPLIAAQVNRLLRTGGRWISLGSLAFPWKQPARRLTVEEVTDVCREQGFDVALTVDEVQPYMRSPASRHGRMEEVCMFAADKLRRSPRDASPHGGASWLHNHDEPVPRSTALALAADASRIQAIVLAHLDGVRTVNDLVRLLAGQGLLPVDQARAAVCGLLERLVSAAE